MKALLFFAIVACFISMAFIGCDGPSLDVITFPEPYDTAVIGVREVTWEGNDMKVRYLSKKEFSKLKDYNKIHVKSIGDALLWRDRISSGNGELFMESDEIVDLAIKIFKSEVAK